MKKELKTRAISWLKEEIRSLELAPELNGCPMTPEWAEQLEIMRTCLEAVQDHFPDTTKMVPLTLEQLQEMDGKPVYWMEDDSWGIISVDSAGPWAGIPFFRGRKFEVNFEYDIESRGMDVYAYQPAHIDRELWEPCDQCKSCESCYKLDSFHCFECKEMSEFVPDSSFCGKCGRPRTLEAWKQMEKRLRVTNP